MNINYLWSKMLKKLKGTAIQNSKIHPTSKIESGSHIVNTTMEKHSFCGYDCEIINCNIGSFCSIANNVVIGGGMHPMEWVSTSPVFYKGRDSVKAKFSEYERPKHKLTKIGHDVWIGQYALLKQGITIGNGAVVGMGSVVTKDVEPYTVVAGNPAKVIRKRFSDEIIQSLLKSEWWKAKESDLKVFANEIQFPEKFLLMITKKNH